MGLSIINGWQQGLWYSVSGERRRAMPSPFPGMDPYLEAPHYWPGFHTNLATEIQAALNREIRPRYIADVTTRQTYDEIQVARPHSFSPDVAVSQPQPPRGEGPVAVATLAPAPAVSKI